VSWLSDAGASNSLEWDFYGGYKGALAGDLTYDIGGLYYYYPGRYDLASYTGVKPHTFEVYGALGWKTITAKYSHSTTNIFGFPDSKGAGYVDLSGTFELGAGFNLIAHVGHQSIPSTAGRTKSDCSYTDYKIGVTTDQLGFTWGLAFIDTNSKAICYTNAYGRDTGKAVGLLSVTKTF
jgi:uncharacterized protein (TIGR02001 family)